LSGVLVAGHRNQQGSVELILKTPYMVIAVGKAKASVSGLQPTQHMAFTIGADIRRGLGMRLGVCVKMAICSIRRIFDLLPTCEPNFWRRVEAFTTRFPTQRTQRQPSRTPPGQGQAGQGRRCSWRAIFQQPGSRPSVNCREHHQGQCAQAWCHRSKCCIQPGPPQQRERLKDRRPRLPRKERRNLAKRQWQQASTMR
jgi:hypothetical protein